MRTVFYFFWKFLGKSSGTISSKPSVTLQIWQKLNAPPHKPPPKGQGDSRNTLNNLSRLGIFYVILLS